MSDTGETLVRMVNQIAANMMHDPDPAGATARHMRLYWDPRMKMLITQYDGEALSEVSAAAVGQL